MGCTACGARGAAHCIAAHRRPPRGGRCASAAASAADDGAAAYSGSDGGVDAAISHIPCTEGVGPRRSPAVRRHRPGRASEAHAQYEQQRGDLNRLVDAQHQRPLGGEGGHEQVQQDAAGAQARPDGSIEDAMKGPEGRHMSQAELTMRRPGARIAPTTRSGTWRHVRRENSGVKGLRSASMWRGGAAWITSCWLGGDASVSSPPIPPVWIKSSSYRTIDLCLRPF